MVNSGNSLRRWYPPNHPSLPGLRTESREKIPIHHIRANTLFEPPATAPLIAKSPAHSRSSSVDSQMTSTKDYNRRQACDFGQELALAYRELMEQQTKVKRPAQTIFPPVRTQEIGFYTYSPPSRTPSSTYSSSLYTTDDGGLDFPLPPVASPDILGFCNDSPTFSEDTGQINSFLREKYSTFDRRSPTLICPRNPPSSVPISLNPPLRSSRDTGIDLNWTPDWDGTGFGDFSWEACSQDNGEDETNDTDNILGKIELLDAGVRPSRLYPNTLKPKSPLLATHLKTVNEDEVDEVSIVLDALRSTFDLGVPDVEDSGSEDDLGNISRAEPSRLGERRSQEVAEVAQRDAVLTLPASCPESRTLYDSGDRRTMRLSLPREMHITPPPTPPPDFYKPQLCYQPLSRQTTSKQSSAYERLESSISRLNEFGYREQIQRSYPDRSAPAVPPKDGIQDSFLPVASKTCLSCCSGIVRRKPSYDTISQTAKYAGERHREAGRHVHRSTSLQTVRTVEYNDREKNRHNPHTRPPSVPLLSYFQGPTKPSTPFSIRRPIRRPIRKESLGRLKHKGAMASENSRHSSAQGLMSFMESDIYREDDTRHVSRARFSQFPPLVNTTGHSGKAKKLSAHSEKARKLLARASSTMTNLGKGIARVVSYGSKKF